MKRNQNVCILENSIIVVQLKIVIYCVRIFFTLNNLKFQRKIFYNKVSCK